MRQNTRRVSQDDPGYSLSYSEWPGDFLMGATGAKAIQHQADLLTAHLQKQLLQHNAAVKNTNVIFERLLSDITPVVESFHQAFKGREMVDAAHRVTHQVDPDRSVGIMNVPLAYHQFYDPGQQQALGLEPTRQAPVVYGRIIAIHGNLMDSFGSHFDSFADMLDQEIASLYVPADPASPAVMRIRHLHGEEHYFHQVDAARLFLLKTVELTCSGGFYHEEAYSP